jgi:hypothetical protein
MELKNILYAGYKKYGYVFRSGKTASDKIVPEKFEVFSPKVFVTYEGLEEILRDRSINIVMIRTDNPKVANVEIDELDVDFQQIRDCLYLFALKYWKDVKKIYEELPEEESVHARYREIWRPLFALAKFFSDELYRKIISLAVDKIKVYEQEEQVETREMILLMTLREMVKEDGFYAIVDIKEKIKELFNEDFSNDWIGVTLSKKFGFEEAVRLSRKGRPTARKITVKKLEELCRRYGVKPIEEIQRKEEKEEKSEDYRLCELCGKRIGKLIVKDGVEHYVCEDCLGAWMNLQSKQEKIIKWVEEKDKNEDDEEDEEIEVENMEKN